MVAVEVALDVAIDLQTDPIGGAVTVTITDTLDAAPREALLDDIWHDLVGRRNNLVFQTVQEAHSNLEAYAGRHDYHVDPLIDSFDGVDAERDRQSVHAEWSWSHGAMSFFCFGTSDHTVEGDPLVFQFDPEKYPYLDEMFPGGTAFLPSVDVSGLPESRAVRDSLHWLRREIT